MSITIYTAAIGDYDGPIAQYKIHDHETYRFRYPFHRESLGWRHTMHPAWIHSNPRRTQRYCKLVSGPELPGDVKIYMDANMALKMDPGAIVERVLPAGVDLALLKHHERNCLFAEARECIRLGYGDEAEILKQMEAYGDHPHNFGLWACGFMVYRNNVAVRNLFADWWTEYRRNSERDQIAFPYVLRRSHVTVNSIDAHPWDNPYFRLHAHLKKTADGCYDRAHGADSRHRKHTA